MMRAAGPPPVSLAACLAASPAARAPPSRSNRSRRRRNTSRKARSGAIAARRISADRAGGAADCEKAVEPAPAPAPDRRLQLRRRRTDAAAASRRPSPPPPVGGLDAAAGGRAAADRLRRTGAGGPRAQPAARRPAALRRAQTATTSSRELATVTQLLTRQRTDANRVRLAVLYTLSRANPQDDQRAVQLLDNVARATPARRPSSSSRWCCRRRSQGRQRAVRDEQQKADTALQKLEALRQMERSLHPRSRAQRRRPAVPAAAGRRLGGGGSGGGSRRWQAVMKI